MVNLQSQSEGIRREKNKRGEIEKERTIKGQKKWKGKTTIRGL